MLTKVSSAIHVSIKAYCQSSFKTIVKDNFRGAFLYPSMHCAYPLHDRRIKTYLKILFFEIIMANRSFCSQKLNIVFKAFQNSYFLLNPYPTAKCRLLNFSSATNFKVLPSHLNCVRILSECQTAWTRVRRRFTRRFTRIQAVCLWNYGLDRQD